MNKKYIVWGKRINGVLTLKYIENGQMCVVTIEKVDPFKRGRGVKIA